MGIRIRIQHFFWLWIWIQGFDAPKSEICHSWEKNFFDKKLQFLSLGLYKGRLSYRRSLQPSKENIQRFKTWNFFTFFYFCGSFLPSWIRIWIQQLTLIRINADPDPDPKPWPLYPTEYKRYYRTSTVHKETHKYECMLVPVYCLYMCKNTFWQRCPGLHWSTSWGIYK
jgi:hypothetical protein